MSDLIERLNYYQRQFLGALDFEAQQVYHRDMRRRHQLAHHLWGIVVGLQLIEIPTGNGNEVEVFISPGIAIDGYGREIILTMPVALDMGLFEGFGTARFYPVWITYDEELAVRPAYGYEGCDPETQYGRVREGYRILVGPQPTLNDGIIVDGKTAAPLDLSAGTPQPEDLLNAIPADESVPYQELPSDDDLIARWLIPLGSVNADPAAGMLIQTPAAQIGKLIEGRRYVGVVGQDVVSPSTTMSLRPREAFIDVDAQDFATVAGRLQIDGRTTAKKDVHLHGGKLRFQNPDGTEDTIPFWMSRTLGADTVSTDLRIHIGDNPAPTTRLTVGTGPADGKAEKVNFSVNGDDTVSIPTGKLGFGALTRQMINLYSTTYGLGVQSSALYFRTNSDVNWFRGGIHSDTQGDPGTGGTLAMKLDNTSTLTVTGGVSIPTGALSFGAAVRQHINLWGSIYGIGVQDWTLYYRTGGDVCWFRNGVHSNARSDPGLGGTLAMKLDSASNLSVAGGISANNSLTVGGAAAIGSNLAIGGTLNVAGTSNLIKVATITRAVKNAAANTPGTVVINYGGEGFTSIYGAYVVFQGFSIYDYEGNTGFAPNSGNHIASTDLIPQHAYARIVGLPSNTQATVEVYCGQSDETQEDNNTVLFTLVVMGKIA